MKYAAIVIIVLILAGGGVAWWYSRDKAAAAAAAANAVPTAKVERGDVKVSVQSTGAVASNRDVDIKCKASGNIVELPYKDVSAIVPPGGLLMRLDTTDEDRLIKSAQAVVDADQAKLQEAVVNRDIAKLSLVTTTLRTKADLASAQAKAQDAANKAKRTQELFDKKLASAEDLETARTTSAQANADVQTAQAAVEELKQQELAIETKEQQIKEIKAQCDQDAAKLETAQTNRDYCTVNAPTPDPGRENDPPQWRVSKLTAGVAIGYLVQSGSSGSSGGTTVMSLADMSHVFVLATVDESDIGALLTRFDSGQNLTVNITADAYPGVEFTGKVVRIATIGVNTSNVVTFEVKIEVTSPNRTLLRPIMTANVDIISAERDNVLTVPVQAVSRHRADVATDASRPSDAAVIDASDESPATAPAGKKHKRKLDRPAAINDAKTSPGTVTIVKPDGSTESREVVVGLSDGTTYEVISGLQEGEVVALNKLGADSKWRGGRGGARSMMRGIGRR